MKSLIGLLSLASLPLSGSSSLENPTKQHQSSVVFNNKMVTSSLPVAVVEQEVEEDSLETYTYKKTSNFSKSYVSFNKKADQSIDIKFDIERMWKDIVEIAKKAGQIKEEREKKSYYTQIKDDLLINASSILDNSNVYVKAKKKEERTLRFRNLCGIKVLTQTQNTCTIQPLGIVEKMHFQLNLNPRSWSFHRKSAVLINNTFGFVSDPNPELNSFYGMEIFNNTKVVTSGTLDFVNLESELDIWEKDVVSPSINANFSDTIWANQNSIKKKLYKGQNVVAEFNFSSLVETPFPPILFYVPVLLFLAPIAYYAIRKNFKI